LLIEYSDEINAWFYTVDVDEQPLSRKCLLQRAHESVNEPGVLTTSIVDEYFAAHFLPPGSSRRLAFAAGV
jgi:hypothetical protein